MRLWPTLPFASGETPESYVSRLARANGIESASQFAGDLGIGFQHVLAGRDDALAKVAELAGVAPEALSREACARFGNLWTLRGQTLARDGLTRGIRHVCAACFADDARDSNLPPGSACRGLSTWQVAHLRTCHVHGLAMGPLTVPSAGWIAERDLAARVGPFVDRLEAFALAQAPRKQSPLEAYLSARLDGAASPHRWLDALPFHAAAKACEMVGAVYVFGKMQNLDLLGDADWHKAGAEGYGILVGGPVGIDAFLADLRRSHDRGRAVANGPQAWFGRLYTWLAFNNRDPGYGPLRDLITRHLADNVPLAPGQKVFGGEVAERRVHSLRTAFLETGVHPTRLRKILAFAGHLAADDVGSDHQVTFNAVATHDLLRRLTGAYTGQDLPSALNAKRVQAKLLVRAGFLKPVVAGADADVGWKCYAREDVEKFLADLSRDAVPVAAAPDGAYPMQDAAKRACCHSSEIVTLILNRRLAWVGRVKGVRGYGAILVDVSEVRRLVRGEELGGVPPSAAYKQLRMNWRSMTALIADGVIRTTIKRHPSHRVPVPVITQEEAERFGRAYVSLFEAARELGVHHMKLKCFLSGLGVEPTLVRERYHASFYLRADVDRVAGEARSAVARPRRSARDPKGSC